MMRIRRVAAAVWIVAFAIAAAPEQRPGWLGFGFNYHRDELDPSKPGWLMVERVAASGPAEKGGLRPHDVILEIDGKPFRFRSDLEVLQSLAAIKPRQAVVLTVVRLNQKQRITIVTGDMSDDRYAAWQRNFANARSKAARQR